MIMKGIILAGGSGTRLGAITKVVSKQLLPVYDKPLIYYSLSTLISFGVKEVLVISTPEAIVDYKKLLGNGSACNTDRHLRGIKIDYEIQTAPRGIAEAYLIGEQFVGNDMSVLILGDNVFHGGELKAAVSIIDRMYSSGCYIFAYRVSEPYRYGVVELSIDYKYGIYTVKNIEEKPTKPKTDLAIPGLYIFDGRASKFARELQPSARGELEITDLIDKYINLEEAFCYKLSDEFTWLDAGTHDSLLEASNFVAAVQKRTGRTFGDPYDTVADMTGSPRF